MNRNVFFAVLSVAVVLLVDGLFGAEPEIEYVDRTIDLQFTAMQEPVAPIQPEEADLPERQVDVGMSEDIGSAWGGLSLPELPTELAASPVGSVVSGDESALRGTTDVGDLLEQSGDTGNVMLFSRSPVSNEPRIRGYRYAQIRNTVDGAYFFPIRPDLDSVLSRIDSSLIEDVSVIDGPYAVRYGPGFAFINVQMKRTERSLCGTGTQGRTAASYDTNGEAWYGMQTFHAGADNYGYRVSYVQRTGSDYRAGDGHFVAASHNARTLNCAFGYDPSENSTFEFNYLRNDLTGIDLPAQVNDLTFLTSDAFQMRYELENQYWYDELSINAWYNTGHFVGNSDNKSIFPFPGFSTTSGRNYSLGTRAIATWGTPETGQAAVGADFSLQRHQYLEQTGGWYGLAPTKVYDTGVFADATLPINDRVKVKAGTRVDWIHVDADGTRVGWNGQPENFLPGRIQNFDLFAAYLIGEYELSPELSVMMGYGLAERAPTPTDLFADVPFLAILQEGWDFYPMGNSELRPEMAQQIDIGLSANYENFRGGIRGFYSWIDHFITYEVNDTVNREGQLIGGEAYGDLTLTSRLTYFVNMSYVEGTDWSDSFFTGPIREPMWGIPPYQAVTGLRLTDPWGGETWGIEYRVRIVDDQHRTNITAGFEGEQFTPGFTTHDLRGYWNVSEWVTFVAGAENFGDRNYQEHLDAREDTNYGYPGGVFRRGRNFYFLLEGEY